MQEYIATFHTHIAAMRTQRALASTGIQARLAPVPRYLSASCGTCVFFFAEVPCLEQMDYDVERVVVRLSAPGQFEELLYHP